jgi:hypothetical protein
MVGASNAIAMGFQSMMVGDRNELLDGAFAGSYFLL